MSKTIVGVMGPGADATPQEQDAAFELGKLIAGRGWILLTGGRDAGVMDAASRGAKAAGGLTVGILPTADTGEMSSWIDIPIVTGMGQARNNVNVLSSEVVFACGLGPGTAAEIALAVKARKPVIMLCGPSEALNFFSSFGDSRVFTASGPEEAIEIGSRFVPDEVEKKV
ncbi:MAG TPA: TIGR00725 family protein [Blastocatellia bacterium]|nr:TIGR00725 family protein [Blastocatellia bacterium]